MTLYAYAEEFSEERASHSGRSVEPDSPFLVVPQGAMARPMSRKSDLPFGSEFSPSQIDLGDALGLADHASGEGALPVLPYGEVSGALERVEASGASAAAKLCLRFLILTASRSGEARGATWA